MNRVLPLLKMDSDIKEEKASLNILVVEDNPADVYLINDYLKSSGLNYTITHCTRLAEVIDLLSHPGYDAILLDLGLPDSWGLSTLRKIQQLKIMSAVIVLTGLDDEETALAALKEGAQDYIVKDKLNSENIIHSIKYGIERKKHQEELQKLNAELEQKVLDRTRDLKELIATKDKFFGIIAHDLKNPFSGLLGASEILFKYTEAYDKENIKKLSELLHSSAKNVYAMLENLLEWSRTQTGSIDFKPEEIIVRDIVTENFANIQTFAFTKKIKLTSEVKNGLQVNGDRNMLNTILRNLLNNAIKFTHNGGKVSVNAIKTNEHITFNVKDNGVGIPQEDIGKLFRIDIKYSNRGTSDETGTGLGLLLCKEFVEKHNGKIWVESVINEGSEFKFTIPVKQ
jgi:two-component system, sensor histidine kinase and response regulator